MSQPAEQVAGRIGVVTALTHDGRGIVRAGAGRPAVFIEGALPGERVRYRPLRRRRNFTEAQLEEVLDPAPARVEPRCRYFGLCGGCALQHLATAEQQQSKQRSLMETLNKIGGVAPRRELEPLAAEEWGYRRRARLAVKDVAAKGRVLVGFRERHKPYVADMLRCEVLAAPFDGLIGALSELIGSLSIRRRLPQVELAGGDRHAAMVLRVLDEPSPADLAQVAAFGRRHGIDMYLQRAGPDSLQPVGESARPLSYGLPEFDLELQFEPTDFVQIHAGLNRRMVSRALELLDPHPGELALDLFCGLGNFSLPLARRCRRVVGVEGESSLVARAGRNAARNGIANAEFHICNLYGEWRDLPWAGQRYDVVLLDPPRAGAAEVVARVKQLGARRIVYVSCNPATLARDAAVLVRDHGYLLSAAGVVDMFPHTAHVEAMALFERADSGGAA